MNIEKNQLFFEKPTYNKNNEYLIKEHTSNYKNNIEKLKDGVQNIFSPIDATIINKFPILELINEKYKILNLLNNTSEEGFSKLFLSFETNRGINESNYQLTKLVLLNNLLELDTIRLFDNSVIKEQILTNLQEINLNELNKAIQQSEIELQDNFGFGREDKQQEFKSSIVYFAGENKENFEKQIFVIMKTIAGFLNSKGGTLLIGVDDEGKIIGLNNDYNYFGNGINGDKYERIIREEIVKVFKKEINGLIDIKIINRNKLEYCEIIIPEYDKLVFLKDNLYQRQGNETRILTGEDLASFSVRKFQDKNTQGYNKAIPTSKHNFYEELHQESKEFSSSNGQKREDDVILAYLYFLENGSYCMYDERQTFSNKYEIFIHKEDRKGYLLQCYDNGCINKVEIRTFLEKAFGTIYQHGLNNNAKLLNYFIIKEESLIVAKSRRDNEEYIKVYKSDELTTHVAIHSIGINILQRVFDELIGFFVISMDYSQDLDRIIYKSRQNLGAKVNDKSSFQKEIEILNKIL